MGSSRQWGNNNCYRFVICASLGNFSSNGCLWRSTDAAPSDALSITFVFVDHSILGALVGDPAETINGGRAASV